MIDERLNVTRRDFMIVSAAAISAPMLTDLSCLIPGAQEAETVMAAEKDHVKHADPNCTGCQVCTIFFSNCHALNGRHCWCKPA